MFKLLSFQYTQKEDLEKMVQNPTFQHCTNIEELSNNAQKKNVRLMHKKTMNSTSRSFLWNMYMGR